jgi:hypothetical protein
VTFRGSASTSVFVNCLLIATIIAVVLLAYSDILTYFFTATDSFTLIETSRIQFFSDFGGLFTKPLMHGTKFEELAKYYRPITSLSYGIDYSIWKLNPFGYQLTDLILHMLVSLLAFKLTERLTHSRIIAWLAAIIFTTHPILMETVPAVARRQDVIAAIFIILSLWFFMNYYETNRKGSVILSIIAYILALGAKEIAVILFPLVFLYSALDLRQKNQSFQGSVIGTIRKVSPYFIVSLIYIVWRWHVLQGMGGLSDEFNRLEAIKIFVLYVLSLSYLLDFIYTVPIMAKMNGPFQDYIGAIIVAFSLALLFCLSLLVIRKSRVLLFLLIWLLLPLGVFLLTRTYEHHSMYISVIPFSAILAIVIVKGPQAIIKADALKGGLRLFSSPLFLVKIAIFCFFISITIHMLKFSPLLNRYGEWRDSGELSSKFLHRLTELAVDLPDRTRLNIYGLPKNIAYYRIRVPNAKTVSYLYDYSIESWIRLAVDKDMEVSLTGRPSPFTCPSDINLKSMDLGEGVVEVSVSLDQ